MCNIIWKITRNRVKCNAKTRKITRKSVQTCKIAKSVKLRKGKLQLEKMLNDKKNKIIKMQKCEQLELPLKSASFVKEDYPFETFFDPEKPKEEHEIVRKCFETWKSHRGK